MKLERIHESLLSYIVLLGGLVLAIILGSLVGSGATGKVGMILFTIGSIASVLIIRERMWMLIPACWMLSGKVSVLPLPFSLAHLAVLFAFGTFLLLKAFKLIRLKPKVGFVEIWMGINLVYLLTVFLRNPVGVEALGSDRVGGRPYFDVVVACAGYWVLTRVSASPMESLFIPILAGLGHGFTVVINVIANNFPSTIRPMALIYSGIGAAEDQDGSGPLLPDENEGRKAYLQGFGANLFLAACSLWRPLTLLNPLNFGRFIFFAFAALAILLSGFRSAVITGFALFMLGTYFRRGGLEVFRITALCVLCIGLLLLLQGNVLNLPLPVQRSLSFLPGKWDYSTLNEAQGSTEWRLQMWKTILSGNKYIENKWLGDGFGFTRRQLEIMTANAQTGSTLDQQENLMINGGVHSGPVSSIRFVGFLGLALFAILLILVAIRAVQLIRRSEGTPYYFLALYIGMPAIWYPLYFTFIFGAFEVDLPNAIIAIGMQRLLENSLDSLALQQQPTPTPVKPISKFPAPPRYAGIGRIS